MKLRGLFSTARFRDFRRRVKDWIPDLPARAWACAIIPTILCLSFLISVGPTVQETLVGLLSSDAPTVYGSAYEDNLVDFPTLGEWLLQGVHWLYLAMAVPPVIFAARSTRFSYFICRLTAAIFVILCVTDFLFETLDRSLTVSSALINCASNLAGSVLLIFTLSAIFWIYEAMRGLAPTGYSDMAGAVSLFLIGASLSSACYFILSYFYRPVEVAFELVAKAPVHGGYVSRPEKLQKEEGAYRRPLSIIPEEAKGGQGHATIPGEVAVIGWKSGEPHKVFDVTIDFFSDCPYSKDIRSLPSGPASIVRKNVKSFALTTDKGLNVIEIAEHPQNGFSYTAKTPHFFWLTRPDEKKPQMEVQFFGGPDAEFVNRGPDGQLFYVSFALMHTDLATKSGRVAPRSMKIVIDGEPITLKFRRPQLLDPNGKLDCGSFKVPVSQPQVPATGHAVDVPMGTLMVGARIKIDPRPVEAVEVFKENVNRLRIAKANGWSKVENIDPRELAGKLLGQADLFFIEDGLSALKIDGAVVEANRTDQFVAMGKIEGRYDADLSLHIRGTAKALWLDSKRRNPTRWERLPLEVQLFILTGFLAALGGILRISKPVLTRFRDPKPLKGLG